MAGKPAARMSDTAMDCADPADTPTGVVIAVGTVLINKLPAAKQNDQVVGIDVHIVMIPSPGGPIPTPLPHPFVGMIDGDTESTVEIMGQPAAVVGSTASNKPPHIPQGGPFQKPPADKAKIMMGSPNVLIGGGSGGSGSGGGSGESEAETKSTATEAKEGHYLDVKFTDKGGKPVMGINYKIKDPDGNETDGTLTGKIERKGVKEGSHEVSLQAITKAAWSKKTAKADDKIKLTAGLIGIESGSEAVFQIFRKGLGSADELYETLETATEGDKAEVEWIFQYRGDEGDPNVGKEKLKKYSLPQFYFTIRVENIQTRSGILQITDDLEIVLKDENGNPIADEKYEARLATGEIREGKLDKNGKATEKDVPTKKTRIVFPKIAKAKKLPK